jgi:hypothetical protein
MGRRAGNQTWVVDGPVESRLAGGQEERTAKKGKQITSLRETRTGHIERETREKDGTDRKKAKRLPEHNARGPPPPTAHHPPTQTLPPVSLTCMRKET